MAQGFSNAVAVLMRDTTFRNFRLVDLEWLVLPPIMAGQFKLGHAQADQDDASQRPNGMLVPIALAVWARVSRAIDKTLSESLDEKLWLRANEWASGDNIWIMAVAGDPRAIPTFLKQLLATELKGQCVRMRTRGQNGEVVVKTLNDTV
jgi:hemolysin-activating ACP:hemolysin acyltransferase